MPLGDRYLALIDEIVQLTLQGKISSVEMVYQMLQKGVTTGTGEVFELVLSDRLTVLQSQVDSEKDELKQAKANRSLRAIKTIQNQWRRYWEQNKAIEAIALAVKDITTASADERFTTFLRWTDPNQKQPLNLSQLQQLAKGLQQFAQVSADIEEIAQGINSGLATWQQLQDHLIGWIYEQNREIGFGGGLGEKEPWGSWAKKVNSEFPQALFRSLALEESVIEFVQQQHTVSLSDWVEMTLILQYLQRGLVKLLMNNNYDGCLDLKHADEMGATEAKAAIKKNCK